MEPLFNPWRSIWRRSVNAQPLLDQLDALTAQRSRGNQILPAIPKTLDRPGLRETFNAMHDAYENRSALSAEQITLWKKAVGPALAIERWGRWLHLEHALQIASRSGDLLFAALLLRSMGEETLRLLVLDFPNVSKYLEFKTPDAATKAWLSGALIAVEPLVQSHESAIAPHSPRYFSLALGEKASSSLREVNKSLNDYVHPNFGSHVLGCFPEESSGITAILAAAVSIYSAFLSMEWTRETVGFLGKPLPETYLTQMPNLQWRIASRVLKGIRDALSAPDSTDQLDALAFFNWLRQSDGLSEGEKEVFVEEDFLNNLEPLLPVETNNKARNATAALIQSIESHEFPLRFRGVSVLQSWSIARRADSLLTSQRTDLKGPLEVGTTEWLRFTAYALHLAISVSLLKLDMLIGQTAFQVASRNALGTVFCARSILEVLASVDWLIDSLESSWDEIVRQVRHGSFTEVELKKINSDLAVFLTGSKGSLEEHRDWGERWSVSGSASLGMLEVVEKSFRDRADIRKIYDISSAMVHGRLMRGVEILSTEVSSKNYLANLFRGICVADLVCDDDTQMSLRSRAARMSLRLKSLETAMGRGDRSSEALERATLAMDSLQVGSHFSGTGKKDDPIKFADGVPYYEGFYRYCSQLGLDSSKRRLEQSGETFLDAVQAGDKTLYFLPPPIFDD